LKSKDHRFIIKTSFERLFSLCGGFRKSGGFQSFILEFNVCYSLLGGFQETYILGLALADSFRASDCIR
jgi:hypothetical protein